MSLEINLLKQFIKRIAISYFIFSLARLIFLLFNLKFFVHHSVSELISCFFYGLLFDTSAIVYLNTLFIVLSLLPFAFRAKRSYQTVNKFIFMLFNIVALIMNMSDVGYFEFSKKRTGIEIFVLSENLNQGTWGYITNYWYIFLITFALIFLLFFLYKKTTIDFNKKSFQHNFLKSLVIFLIFTGLWVVGARGGFYYRPIRPFDATRFASPDLTPLIVSTPFQFIQTIEKKPIEKLSYFDNKTLNNEIQVIKKYKDSIPFQKKNVVIIIMESMATEYLFQSNTPFLDSLAKTGTYFPHSYADGTRTLDALPAVLAGIPCMMDEHFYYSLYCENIMDPLGKHLKKKDYDVQFFYGGLPGAFGFDNFIRSSESGEYHSKDDYPYKEHFIAGSWGIDDDLYLPWVAEQIDSLKEPFLTTILTLSLHEPYIIPKHFESKVQNIENNVKKSIFYADYALKQFFNQVKSKAWYSNTLFVLTGDHTSHSFGFSFENSAKKFEVPIIFYTPDKSFVADTAQTIQQIDILPTVLDYLHYDSPFYSFGTSVIDRIDGGFAVQYIDNVYQIIQYPYLLKYDLHRHLELGFYTFSDGKLTVSDKKDKQTALLKRLKAFLQTFNRDVADNTMHYDSAKYTR